MKACKSRCEQISELINAGVVDSALGRILTGKSETDPISELVGITVTATYNAFNDSVKHAPVLIVDNYTVYKVDKNGSRNFIRSLKKPDTEIPETFNIY